MNTLKSKILICLIIIGDFYSPVLARNVERPKKTKATPVFYIPEEVDPLDDPDEDPVLFDKRTLLAVTTLYRIFGDAILRANLDPEIDTQIQKLLFRNGPSGESEPRKNIDFRNRAVGHALFQAYMRATQSLNETLIQGVENKLQDKDFFTKITDEDLKTRSIHYEIIKKNTFIQINGHLQYPLLGERVDKRWKDYFRMAAASGFDIALEGLTMAASQSLVGEILGTGDPNLQKKELPNLENRGRLFNNLFGPADDYKYRPVFNPFGRKTTNFNNFLVQEMITASLNSFAGYIRDRLPSSQKSGFYTFYNGSFYHVYFRPKTDGEEQFELALKYLNYIEPEFLKLNRDNYLVGERIIPPSSLKRNIRKGGEVVSNFLFDSMIKYVIQSHYGGENLSFLSTFGMMTFLSFVPLGKQLMNVSGKYLAHRYFPGNLQRKKAGYSNVRGEYRYIYFKDSRAKKILEDTCDENSADDL